MAVQREYLSPNEIAELLGVSPFTIRRYIKLGELKAVKLLGGFRVHRDALQRFLKAHEVNSNEEELAPEETLSSGQSAPEPRPLKEAERRSAPSPGRVSSRSAAVPRVKRRRPARKKPLRAAE